MKTICVIGAGPAGLCAIKHCLQDGFKVTGFEKNNQVGGTWVYTDQVGKDKYGVDIHSSMYQGLMTNLPLEIMEYPDFPNPSKGRSFVPSDEILNYFNLYADEFHLRDNIQFEHVVVTARPLLDDKWEVIVKNLPADKYETLNFDNVFVCNGFSVPMVPEINGQEIFKGKQMHSHDFRTAENFIGEKVLIIGAGPSGIEMALEIGKTAKHLSWSNHLKKTHGREVNIELSDTVVQKSDVIKFTENGAEFEDGTFEEFSVVAYATGYDFKFPFLSADCGMFCDSKHIQPLYKHCLNINRPTMAIIGLPFFALGIPMYDLQIRFALKFMSGKKKQPTKDEMMKDMQHDEEERKLKGFAKKKAHFLGLEKHAGYYAELAEIADLQPLKPVLAKIFNKTVRNLFENFNTYRFYNFEIIDEELFLETFNPM